MSDPLVSVLVPAFNSADTLPLALGSLLCQSVEGWECIVVEDGSSDGTRELVESLNDPRFHYARLRTNSGRGVARLTGLRFASGRYLAMLDSDDWWYPWKLEAQLDLFDSMPEVGAVSAGLALVDLGGRISGVRRATLPSVPVRTARTRNLMGFSVPFAPTLFLGELAKEVGFRPELRRSEDRQFLAELTRRAPYCSSHRILYSYSEQRSLTISSASSRFLWRARSDQFLMKSFPISGTMDLLRSLTLAAVFRFKETWGGASIAGNRSDEPTSDERADFLRARSAVVEKARQVRALLKA